MSVDQKRQRAPKIATLEKRARIVGLAREGHTERAIAEMVGLSKTAARYHLEAYRAELTPSSELAEEWRQTRLARADERFRRLGPLALADPPDLQALAALQREEESITKMLGANLEVGVSLSLITREALAAALWEAEDVVDVMPVEITEGDVA